jgi:hypothetical protein
VDAVLYDFPDFAAEGIVLERRGDGAVGQFTLGGVSDKCGDACKAVAGRRARAQNEHVGAEPRRGGQCRGDGGQRLAVDGALERNRAGGGVSAVMLRRHN